MLSSGWGGTGVVRALIADRVHAALPGAFALVGGVSDEEKSDTEDGEDSEKDERKHR